MTLEDQLSRLADVRAPSSMEDAIMQGVHRQEKPLNIRRLALAGACFALWLFTVQGIIGWTTAQLT